MRLAAFALVCAGLTLSQAAAAQSLSSSANREGSRETNLSVVFQNSSNFDAKGGTTADVEGGAGFRVGMGYNYTDNLLVSFDIGMDQMDYKANLAGDEPGVVFPIKGELQYLTLMMNGTYNFFQSRLTPFVTGGLGWTWIDTNIASEPPQGGCWWTWYGYVCTSWQNTKTVDAFSYQAGAGIRYDVSDSFVIQGSYRMTWMNLKDAEGTPDIDGFQLSIGWKF